MAAGCKKEEAPKTVVNDGIINFMTGDVTINQAEIQ
jgi:hypothetical protein